MAYCMLVDAVGTGRHQALVPKKWETLCPNGICFRWVLVRTDPGVDSPTMPRLTGPSTLRRWKPCSAMPNNWV